MTYHKVITKLQLFVHIVIHTQYLLEVTFPLQNYDTWHFYTIVIKMWWLCDWTKKIFFLSSHITITFLWQLDSYVTWQKIFFWSSHITITFLWQWYKNVTCHNFVMEMWYLAKTRLYKYFGTKVWKCDKNVKLIKKEEFVDISWSVISEHNPHTKTIRQVIYTCILIPFWEGNLIFVMYFFNSKYGSFHAIEVARNSVSSGIV